MRSLTLNDTMHLLGEVADLAAVPERMVRMLHSKARGCRSGMM